MPRLAFIGHRYQEQLRTNPEALSGVDVVWQGTTLHDFRSDGLGSTPDVLVLDLDQLGTEPTRTLDDVLRETDAELVFISYPYARREVIDALQSERTRILQGTPSLSTLRSQMLSLIIRDILGPGAESGESEKSRGGSREEPAPDRLRERADESWTSCPTCGQRVSARRLIASQP